MKTEAKWRSELKERIKDLLGDCIILENDPKKIQGIPDLLILFRNHWAALETKRHSKASKRPNQERYVERMNKMSYASFISPETERDVLDELVRAFRIKR